MNFKPSQIAVLGTISALAILGVIAFAITQNLAAADLILLFTAVGTLITVLGVVFKSQNDTADALGEVKNTVDEVQKQTNGRLHNRDAEIERLTDVIIENNIDPKTVTRRSLRESKED